MTSDIELHPDFAPAPTTLFPGLNPAQIVARATAIADVIAPLIRERNLYKRIGQSDHVYLEGWTIAGTMLGVFACTVSTRRIYEDGQMVGYEATVEARTMAGQIVGRADAECTRDENEKWANAPSFQLRSMSQTRGSSKALRMPLAFIMRLAGYDATPAEEMEAAAARGESVSGGRGVAHGWRDKLEQDRAHSRLAEFVASNALGDELAAYLASKGYESPLAKGQWNQVQKAMVRELQERTQSSGPGAPPAPPATPPGSDLTSGAGEREGAPDRHDPASDLNASATGQGDTDVSAGHEPPNAEASMSPSPREVASAARGGGGDTKAGRGTRRGRASAVEAPPGRPPAEPTQPALDDGPEPPGWER